MCWKSKHKPKLEIAEKDIPVKKVLDVTVGDDGATFTHISI